METLTNPSLISQYLFGAQTITNWNVGSDILFKINFEGEEFLDKGIVVENIPNTTLKYKYWSGFCGLDDKPENYSIVSYNIEKMENDRSKLKWTQEGFADEQSRTNSENSLVTILEQIKAITEK
ncbi:MAG TPA: SRPBCC domain-containing protein [Chitinophagaceae bacterium]|nr:SRPBCC domain-containing protein [Chitinophagaceae bacterium]